MGPMSKPTLLPSVLAFLWGCMIDQPLRILYLASEVEPFARTGGLAEVAGALPRALRELGHDVRVALPCYGHISAERWGLRREPAELAVELGGGVEAAGLLVGELPGSDVPVWLIDNQRLFGSPELYLGDQDAERFIFWARAALEAARRSGWQPDVIHANDWHAAIVANWLRTSLRRDPFFRDCASLYTIHTLAYRGVFGQRVLQIAGVAEYGFIAHPALPGLARVVDLMSRGIYYADIINTVSPTHAREILTPAYGEGLDPLLRDRRDRLFGILNGIDPQRYNPAADPRIAAPFDAADPSGKARCKAALQERAGLPAEADTPLLCFIGRLNDQKGFGLLQAALEPLLAHHKAQVIVLGTGEERYHHWLAHAEARHPQAVKAYLTFDDELMRQCYAGSDLLAMPSLVEPGGTNQLIAQRYGTLPLVRATGGLADTVANIDMQAGVGTGFVFEAPETQALYGTLLRALELYRHPAIWQAAMGRAMRADWSWRRTAEEYDDVYRRALASRKARRPRSSYGES